MPHVIWRERAREDVRTIIDYISDRNPTAALRLTDLFAHVAEQLVYHPQLHRTGRVPDTREAIVTPNYILVYRVGAEAIEILNVKHPRQQYP